MKKLVFVLGLILSFKVYAQTSGYCGPKDFDGNYGTNCEWVYDEASKTLTISGYGEMYSTSGSYEHPWAKDLTSYRGIENVVIENGITSIGNHAFYGASSVKNIKMPDTLTTIGWDAFGSEKLESVVIPDSVAIIYGSKNYPLLRNTITAVYCSQIQRSKCQNLIEWSNLDVNVLKIYEKYGDEYYVDGRFYEKPQNIGTSDSIKKRIYTIDEVNAVTGKVNSFKIRYR